jgi:hypothetical protein
MTIKKGASTHVFGRQRPSAGFLRLEITPKLVTGRYYQVPRPQESYSKGNQLFDYFEYDWKKRSYVPNNL